MCGICGFLDFKGQGYQLPVLNRMMQTVLHRGPDGAGNLLGDFETGTDTKETGTIGLSHTRLSIIDLSERGSQPMEDDQKTLAIVFNGEIYNYRKLRRQLEESGYRFKSDSDTETLIYSYKEWGEQLLMKVEGMFAFAIWDKQKRRLFLARDRLGIKPLYYFYNGLKFAFASELKALMTLPFIQKRLNLEALCDYFETRYIPGPNSIIEQVFKLQPGHYLIVGETGAVKTRYWELPVSCDTQMSWSDVVEIEKLDEILNNVVKAHLVSDVPVGTFLSGGIDSSLITALAQRHYTQKIRTFTIGFKEPAFDEAPYAAAIAKHLNTEHTEHYIAEEDLIHIVRDLYRVYDEPFGDASAIPTIVLSKEASKVFKVGLSGDGGDELFHGYPWYNQIEKAAKIFLIPYWARRGAFPVCLTEMPGWETLSGYRERKFGLAISQKMALFRDWERKALMGKLTGSYPLTVDLLFGNGVPDRVRLYDKLLRLALASWLPDDFLVKVDRASMFSGLEVRVPFLDNKVVEHTAAMPLELKKRKDVGKHMLREVLNKYVPRRLFDRPKKGFSVPLVKWLSKDLRSAAWEILSAENIRKYKFLNEGYVRKLLIDCDERPGQNHAKLWLVLNFQLWCDQYLG